MYLFLYITMKNIKNKQNGYVFGLATMEAILKKNGAERVSEDAKHALREALELYASELCKKSIKYSIHAGRKTIRGEDIKLSLS
jgi:DNA-binding protein